MKEILKLIAASAIAAAAWIATGSAQAQEEAVRSITHIAGGLYLPRPIKNFYSNCCFSLGEAAIERLRSSMNLIDRR